MRFSLTFRKTGQKQTLPLNYQYELASWIYKTIHRSDSAFVSFLHDRGYLANGKGFKLFTFSNLKLPKFQIQGDRLLLQGDTLSLQLTFALEQSAQHFIQGLFQQQRFSLGDRQSQVDLEVQQIEAMPTPTLAEGSQLRFRTLSPLCVSSSREHYGKIMPLYHHPADDGYENLLLQNLLNKYTAAHGHFPLPPLRPDGEFAFKVLSEPKSRLVTIKANTPQETKVRGFLFDFELQAPEALLQLGYAAGLGEKNSLGFGCVEVVG
ncbi:CRISPR-associated endoribonuclease Cas6 [Rufibacter quisquiliarum]|uniref:CRISPR-associated endoribonuclease n=1 Tax=Rufibacter quisquiliarum TaxID=1549639 RepID=A0A839GMN9_9BACT|nr:CRISPR-associated endoribonuclease Cas6 [Rufibacter quisquiliarum]MBA9075708.1 CRISPR-associated endoribonuclease Cas6 [Rufibacter quisquiliarum]